VTILDLCPACDKAVWLYTVKSFNFVGRLITCISWVGQSTKLKFQQNSHFSNIAYNFKIHELSVHMSNVVKTRNFKPTKLNDFTVGLILCPSSSLVSGSLPSTWPACRGPLHQLPWWSRVRMTRRRVTAPSATVSLSCPRSLSSPASLDRRWISTRILYHRQPGVGVFIFVNLFS